jgi:hypothetical protein
MAAKANFTVVQGDTFSKTPTFRRKTTKVPINLTGATISGTAAGLALTCAVTNGPAGQFSFGLSAVQTAGVPIGVHTYEVICTYADSTVQTLLQGNLVVTS